MALFFYFITIIFRSNLKIAHLQPAHLLADSPIKRAPRRLIGCNILQPDFLGIVVEPLQMWAHLVAVEPSIISTRATTMTTRAAAAAAVKATTMVAKHRPTDDRGIIVLSTIGALLACRHCDHCCCRQLKYCGQRQVS